MTAPRARSRTQTPVKSAGDNLVKPRLRLVHDTERRLTSKAESEPVEREPKTNRGSNRASNRASNRESRAPVRRPIFGSPARRSRLVTFASIAALALVVFSVVVGQVLLAQAAYSKASAERELERARAEYERARLEEATASLPHEVEQRARSEIGLQDVSEEEPLALGPPEPRPSHPDEPVRQP